MRINELKENDRIEFFNEIIKQHGLDHAISCVRDNDQLSACLVFWKTCNEPYWTNLYYSGGYPKVEMTLKEIEEKLELVPGTLKILPF